LQIIDGSQLRIIEDAGHMVMMERPEQVNNCLRDFLLRDSVCLNSDENS